MEFDSHRNAVLDAAVGTVNLLTPGQACGRGYRPVLTEVAGELATVLRGAQRNGVPTPTYGQVSAMADYAHRMRTIFESVAVSNLDAACGQANELLRECEAAPVLAHHDGEPWHLHFHPVAAPFAQSWAGAMTTALAIVLGNPDHDRLGVCLASVCDRVFLDTSRNGTRRFCSLSCQNRQKAAKFRARSR